MVKERPPEGYPEPIIEPGSELDPFRPATEEEIAAAIEHRDRLIQMSNAGARITTLEAELLHSIRVEEHARSVMEQGYTLDPEVIAWSLMQQGRYSEALACGSKHDGDIRDLMMALARPDDERCDCPDVTYDELGKKRTTCSESVVALPWIAARNKFGYLWRCACGFSNLVSELPPDIAKHYYERAASLAQNRNWRPA